MTGTAANYDSIKLRETFLEKPWLWGEFDFNTREWLNTFLGLVNEFKQKKMPGSAVMHFNNEGHPDKVTTTLSILKPK